MKTFLCFLEFLGLGAWLGSDLFLSFVVAPGAFQILATRDQAGAMVGFALGQMHVAGIFCGLIFLLARLLRAGAFASFVTLPALCVALMITLTAVSQYTVSSKMALLRVQMGSIQATATGSPLLAEFNRLHRVSISLESAVLLAGIVAMYRMVREMTPAR